MRRSIGVILTIFLSATVGGFSVYLIATDPGLAGQTSASRPAQTEPSEALAADPVAMTEEFTSEPEAQPAEPTAQPEVASFFGTEQPVSEEAEASEQAEPTAETPARRDLNPEQLPRLVAPERTPQEWIDDSKGPAVEPVDGTAMGSTSTQGVLAHAARLLVATTLTAQAGDDDDWDDIPTIDAGGSGTVDQQRSPAGDNAGRLTIAVIPFEVKESAADEPDAGNFLAGKLAEKIDLTRFRLLERTALRRIIDEQRFGMTEVARDSAKQVEVGKLAQAGVIIVGDVGKVFGVYRWSVRMLDVETGELLRSAQADVYSFDTVHLSALPKVIRQLELGPKPKDETTPPTTAPRVEPVQPPTPINPIREPVVEPIREPVRQPMGQPEPPRDFGDLGVDILRVKNPNQAFRFGLDLMGDFPQFDGMPVVTEADRLRFVTRAEQRVYITLLTMSPNGSVYEIFPSESGLDNLVPANVNVLVPDPAALLPAVRDGLAVGAPHGLSWVKAFATVRPMALQSNNAPQQVEGFGRIWTANQAKAILPVGIEPPRDGRLTAAMMDELFGADGWATAEYVLRTVKMLGDVDPSLTQDKASGPRRAAIVPPRGGVDPNTQMRDMIGRTHAMGVGAANNNANRSLASRPTGFTVVRRNPDGFKSITADPGSKFTYETISIGDGKNIGEPTAEEIDARIQQIQNDDPSIIAVIPDAPLMPAIASFNQPATGLRTIQWALSNPVNDGFDTRWTNVASEVASLRPPLIALLDQGVDYRDPRLQPAMWINPNEIPGNKRDDDGNGYIDDIHGYHMVRKSSTLFDEDAPFNHGSYCMSVIAARSSGKANDITGIAPQASIMSVGVLAWDERVGAAIGSSNAMYEGLRYAMASGAKVINLSLGQGGKRTDADGRLVLDDNGRPVPFFTPAAQSAYNRNPIWAELQAAGILVVVAAGNDNNNNDKYPFMPANLAYDNIITVMAIDPAGLAARAWREDNERWQQYSNYGQRTVDLAAPGTMVAGVPKLGATDAGDGTSYAAPIVAAAAGLIMAKHPDWDYRMVKRAILESVQPIEGLEELCATGGMLDIEAALGWTPQ